MKNSMCKELKKEPWFIRLGKTDTFGEDLQGDCEFFIEKLLETEIKKVVEMIEEVRKSYLGSEKYLSEIGNGCACILDEIITNLKQ